LTIIIFGLAATGDGSCAVAGISSLFNVNAGSGSVTKERDSESKYNEKVAAPALGGSKVTARFLRTPDARVSSRLDVIG
jgi:hypothetical protein